MATVSQQRSGSGGTLLVILIIIVGLIIVGVMMFPTMDDFVETVDNIPMTDHAIESHMGEKYDATAIKAYITTQACKRVEIFHCPAYDKCYLLCKLKGSFWGALICKTGTDGMPTMCITGFPQRYEGWINRISSEGCIGGVILAD
jgi:hypothetical protein